MTAEDLERGELLKKKIDKTRRSVSDLNNCFQRKPERKPERNLKERTFLRFIPGFKRNSFRDDEEDIAYVFLPEMLHGIEIDIDGDIVIGIREILERKLKELESEFEAIGK